MINLFRVNSLFILLFTLSAHAQLNRSSEYIQKLKKQDKNLWVEDAILDRNIPSIGNGIFIIKETCGGADPALADLCNLKTQQVNSGINFLHSEICSPKFQDSGEGVKNCQRFFNKAIIATVAEKLGDSNLEGMSLSDYLLEPTSTQTSTLVLRPNEVEEADDTQLSSVDKKGEIVPIAELPDSGLNSTFKAAPFIEKKMISLPRDNSLGSIWVERATIKGLKEQDSVFILQLRALLRKQVKVYYDWCLALTGAGVSEDTVAMSSLTTISNRCQVSIEKEIKRCAKSDKSLGCEHFQTIEETSQEIKLVQNQISKQGI